MARQGANSIKYGKIELLTTDESTSMDDLMNHLTTLLDKFGYPEDVKYPEVSDAEDKVEPVSEEELNELEFEDEDDTDEPVKPLPPWEKVRRKNDGREDNVE